MRFGHRERTVPVEGARSTRVGHSLAETGTRKPHDAGAPVGRDVGRGAWPGSAHGCSAPRETSRSFLSVVPGA